MDALFLAPYVQRTHIYEKHVQIQQKRFNNKQIHHFPRKIPIQNSK